MLGMIGKILLRLKLSDMLGRLQSIVKEIEKSTEQSNDDYSVADAYAAAVADAYAAATAAADVAQAMRSFVFAAATLSVLGSFMWWKFAMPTIRNMKISTGTSKEIIKELHSYVKEVDSESAKTEEMKARGANSYDLKQQENVLAESRRMKAYCRKTLVTTMADLEKILAKLDE